MPMKVAINGLGRIGRTFLRTVLEDEKACEQIEIVAINLGPCPTANVAHLFKYDSLMGTFAGDVESGDCTLTINGKKIQLYQENDPALIPWKNHAIDWVVESSGCFTKAEDARAHQQAGAKKILITAPAQGEDISIIPGVNDKDFQPDIHSVVSLGSCTTNAYAPVVKILHEAFGIENGMMTTIHAYTNNQVLLDVDHKDPRRARAAALNIIPTRTGAADMITKLFPDLEGKLFARAIRVPVPKVSLLEFCFTTTQPLSSEKINKAFEQASSLMSGIVACSNEPLVSSDYNNNPFSAIIDCELTQASGPLGQVFIWYDNEWGYCCRLKDFLLGRI